MECYSLFTLLISTMILILLTLYICFIIYFKQKFKYWDQFDIMVIPPVIPYGSLGNLFARKEPFNIAVYNVHKTFKQAGERHGGLFVLKDAIYVPVDPLIIKNILIKDFNYFMNRSLYHNKKDDPIGENLLTMDNQEWKNKRVKLTPTFTSGKMKQMLEIFNECGDRLVKKIDECVDEGVSVEVKDTLGCFTTDIIGSCAFGIECNSFENPNSEFRFYGKKIFSFTAFQTFKSLLARNFPNLAQSLHIVTVPKDVSKFFLKIVKENLRYRENNNVSRNDFFQILIDLEKGEIQSEEEKINNIAAQSFLFFNAGFETSSTAMTFALYELCLNPDIQEKLRKEVISTLEKYDGRMTYEALMNMEYLDKVIDETMRKHPPIGLLARKCTQDYQVEGSNVIIKKDSRVFISVLGLHLDPDFYPDPDLFDPERFTEENKKQRPPCTYLPFGDGPRNCIGLRFGLLQVKIGLAVIIKNFKFKLNPKAGNLKLDPKSFINRFAGEVLMDFQRLS